MRELLEHLLDEARPRLYKPKSVGADASIVTWDTEQEKYYSSERKRWSELDTLEGVTSGSIKRVVKLLVKKFGISSLKVEVNPSRGGDSEFFPDERKLVFGTRVTWGLVAHEFAHVLQLKRFPTTSLDNPHRTHGQFMDKVAGFLLEQGEEKLFEVTLDALIKQQSSVTQAFPQYHDRVKAIARKGGVRLKELRPDGVWRFAVHSGTKEGVWYDVFYKVLWYW